MLFWHDYTILLFLQYLRYIGAVMALLYKLFLLTVNEWAKKQNWM